MRVWIKQRKLYHNPLGLVFFWLDKRFLKALSKVHGGWERKHKQKPLKCKLQFSLPSQLSSFSPASVCHEVLSIVMYGKKRRNIYWTSWKESFYVGARVKVVLHLLVASLDTNIFKWDQSPIWTPWFWPHPCNSGSAVSDKTKAVAHLWQVGAEMEESPSVPLRRPGVFGETDACHCQEVSFGVVLSRSAAVVARKGESYQMQLTLCTQRWQLK